jgi:hypothetical protein
LSFVLEISHPSSALGALGRLQLARPSWHDELQSPPEQASDSTPFVLQGRPQAPQFFGSVPVAVSQPSSVAGAWGPLQSLKPDAHECWHLPPVMQLCALLFAVEHVAPQAPQFAAEERFASQPLLATPSQFSKPDLQTNPHCFALHVITALSASGQTASQAPQCSGFVFRSTHSPAQSVSVPQLVSHWPPEQTSFDLHASPQAPQCAGSKLVSTQALPHLE